MLAWLSENIGTILICAVLALIVGLIIVSQIRNRRSGKGGCDGNCAACSRRQREMYHNS